MLPAQRRNWHGYLLHLALPLNDVVAIRTVVVAAVFLCSNEVAIALHCHSKQSHPIAFSAKATAAIKQEYMRWFEDHTSKQWYIADYPTIVIILFNKMADFITTERSLAGLEQYQKFSYSSQTAVVALAQLSYGQIGCLQQVLSSCILVDTAPEKWRYVVLQQLHSCLDKLDMQVNVNMQQI